VIQAFFHAAALMGRTLDHVLRWVANPAVAGEPTEILREHPHAAPYWHGLLQGALHGDERTAGNTITTLQQAMSLFFQDDIRRRCVPGDGRPATDLADLIRRGGTVLFVGPGGSVCLRLAVDDRGRRACVGHRVAAFGQVGLGPAVPTNVGLFG
jgi:type IV secretion system protein VirD4